MTMILLWICFAIMTVNLMVQALEIIDKRYKKKDDK